MMHPLISIVVPVYNVEKYLDRCLDTLIHQTYDNIEIILVNDGSTDNSLQRCEEYARLYDNIICINQKNTGVSGARNKGSESSNGEYITYVDPDDYIEKETIEECVYYLEKNNLDIVTFFISGDEHKVNPNSELDVLTGREAARLGLLDKRGGVVSHVIKSEITKKSPLPGLIYSEDTATCYKRYFFANRVGFLNKIRYILIGDNSTSLTRSLPSAKKRFDTLTAYIQRYDFSQQHYSDDEEVLIYNSSQILRSSLSLLTCLYNEYADLDEMKNTEYYKTLKEQILLHLNNKKAIERLGFKYKLFLKGFEKNNFQYISSKLSFWFKNTKRSLK